MSELNNFRLVARGSHPTSFLYRSSLFYDARDLLNKNIRTIIDLRQAEAKRIVLPQHIPNIRLHHIPLITLSGKDLFLKQAKERAGIARARTREERDALLHGLFSSPEALADMYFAIISHARDEIREIFEILSKPQNYPLMFHCVAGKDRTGIIAGFVSEVIGLDREIIIEEYGKSEILLLEKIKVAKNEMDKLSKEAVALLNPITISSPPQAMRILLKRIESEHESVENFLLNNCGVNQEDIMEIRRILKVSPDSENKSIGSGTSSSALPDSNSNYQSTEESDTPIRSKL